MPLSNSVSVAAGSTIVAGHVTSFVGAEDDLFCLRGRAIPVASVDSTSRITLKLPWPDASASEQSEWGLLNIGPYWRSAITTNRKLNDLLERLGVVLPLKADAAGSFAGRAVYDGQPAGFIYLSTSPLPWTLYVRLTATPGTWSAGQVLGGSGGGVDPGDLAAVQATANAAASALATAASPFGTLDARLDAFDEDLADEAVRAIGIELGLDARLDVLETAEAIGTVPTSPRRARTVTFAITDQTGRVAMLIGSDGAAELVRPRRSLTPRQPRRARQFGAADTDAGGRVHRSTEPDGSELIARPILGVEARQPRRVRQRAATTDMARRGAFAVEDDGSVVVAKPILGIPPRQPRRARRQDVPVVRDRAGRTSMWADRSGRLAFALSPEGAALVTDAIVATPAVIRGGLRGVNVRVGQKRARFTVQESDGLLSDVVQLLPSLSPYATAVADSLQPIRLVITYGQSTAGGPLGPVITTEPYPHHLLTLPNGLGKVYAEGAEFYEPVADGLVPLKDDWLGGPQYLGTLVGLAAERFVRDFGLGFGGPGHGVVTNWWGGQAITTFMPGTLSYGKLLGQVRAFVRAARPYRPHLAAPVEAHIVYSQGENVSSGFATNLATLVDTLRADVQAITGQASAPKFLLYQINQQDTDGTGQNTGQELDILALAKARSGTGVHLVGPVYDCPLGDPIHHNMRGQMIKGERGGLALTRILDFGDEWRPPWITNVARSGAVIDLTYSLPPFGGPLAFDTDWVAAPPDGNKGFTFTDSTSSATIAAVAITGANTVRVTLSAAPTGSAKKLRYALGQDTVSDGWAGGRGLLHSPTAAASPFGRLGYAVPAYHRLYAARSEDTVP